MKESTSKHGDTINVVELAIILFVECSPNVGDKNLWSLHDADRTLLEYRFITEACKVMSEEVDEFAGTFVGCFDKVGHAAVIFLYNVSGRGSAE